MAKLSHDNALYYMKRAKVLLDHVEQENGENDHILPQGGNKELIEIIMFHIQIMQARRPL